MESFECLRYGALRLKYNNLELRQLKDVHLNVPSVPNFMDFSLADQEIYDTRLTLFADAVLRESEEVENKKGMIFDSLEHPIIF